MPRRHRLYVSLLVTAASVACCAPRALGQGPTVAFNEVHYHPGSDTQAEEFIEFYNYGAEPVDLTGWVLTGGVEHVFSGGTTIEPDGYLVLAFDPATFQLRYPDFPEGVPLFDFDAALGNAGERLELYTDGGYLVSYLEWEDESPWPEGADGFGPSMERIAARREEGDPRGWRASTIVGGTPGRENSVFREDPISPPGGGESLVPRGAEWHYFKGFSEPPADWRDLGFDDSGWAEDNAGFGYGDGDDATFLDDMQFGYTTVYLRREFEIADPSRVSSLQLEILIDDGYVAYINGVEIDRFSVPGPPGNDVPFDAGATNSIEPPLERSINVSSGIGVLVTGTNVLAVQGVNRALDNPDFSLDPSLRGDILTGSGELDIIPAGADWHYLRGTDAPPPDWNTDEFNDVTWDIGAAGFGYGDGDDNTELNDMSGNYITVFVRRAFELTDLAEVESALLRIRYDDGFVAYLNGTEVARSNADDDSYDAPANGSHEASSIEEFALDIAALQVGTNVLAVQGHNNILTSGDFSLDPYLTLVLGDGEPPPPPGVDPTRRTLAINEVQMSTTGEGWIELYNSETDARDISGLRLRIDDDPSREYVIPAATSVGGNDHWLVSEADLGTSLDAIATVILLNDAEEYLDGMILGTPIAGVAYGRFPDGNDNRRALTVPTPDDVNDYTAETGIVINEIQYHPGDDDTGGEFIELTNTSAQTVDLSGWEFTRGVSYTFPAATELDPGEFLVIARDPAALSAFHGIPTPLGPYVGALNNAAETLMLRDTLRNPVDRVRHADEGSWPEDTDGLGPSAELVHPDLENRYGMAWAASSGFGTPGAENSAFASDPNPIVVDVEHAPVVPAPSDTVRVTAIVSDVETLDDVTLFWRRDGSGGPPQEVAMADDGIDDDGIAGNGVYGAEIPPHAHRDIVCFWIEATAPGGESTIVPAGAPDPTFLYQVENPSDEGARPRYRLILKDDTLNEFLSRSRGSNVLLDCTFVAGDRAYYNRGLRLRGNSARSCNPLSYRVQFDHDNDFEGIKRLNINGCNAAQQWSGLDFLTRAGIATPLYWLRSLSFNGQVESGLRLRVESIDQEFLERVYPTDATGNLYRGVGQANLDYRGEDFGNYTNHYQKETNEEAADWSDVVELCFRFDADTTSDEDFPAAIEAGIDVQQWAHYFAVYAMLGSTENSIVLNNGDDYFLYHRPSDGRWILLPWDLDSCFDDENQALFRPSVDQIERFLEHPLYAPLYWCSVESLRLNNFTDDIIASRLELIRPFFSTARMDMLDSYHPERRQFLDARISSTLSLNVLGGGSICDSGNTIEVTGGQLTLEGDAPGCFTTSVIAGGETATYDPINTTWNATVDVSGESSLLVEAYNRDGILLTQRRYDLEPSSAPTPFPTNINSSRTFDLADSPYRVPNNAVIAAGATVTLEPGVRLLFDFDATLTVEGTLIARGTAENPIHFDSDNCGELWEGLVLDGGASEFEHCFFANFTTAQGFDAGMVVRGGHVATFTQVDVTAEGGTTALEIDPGAEVSFIDSALRGGAVGLMFDGGDGVVSGSRLSDANIAIHAEGSAEAEVQFTLLSDCGTALSVADGGTMTADHLTIVSCQIGIRLEETQPGEGTGSFTAHSLIVWDVSTATLGADSENAPIQFSNLQDSTTYPGEGNINDDPLFMDLSGGDLRLTYFSPSRASGFDGTDMGAFPFEPSGETSTFLRCDSNGDGDVDISDAFFALLHLFQTPDNTQCIEALDCNHDGSVDLTDVIFDLNYIFLNGVSPAAPFPACDVAPIEGCAETTCQQ